MPQNRNNPEPPTMTWLKATPILVAAGIFDLIRGFFEMFWLFGPAMAAMLCTLGVNNWLNTTLATTGGQIVAGVCTAAAGVAGFYGVEITESFGDVMAMAIGLAGFLVLGLWILASNARIFKVNATGSWWFIGGFGVGEIPFVGAIPAFFIVLFRLYRNQIRIESAALKKWEREQGEMQLQERNQKIANLMQARATDEYDAQMEEDEEVEDEEYNDEEIPEEVREAA